MAKERLVESFSVSKKDIKPIVLNESNAKILHEGKEFDVTFAYKFPQWVLDKKNLNGRIYSTELAKKIVKENKVTFGLCNHPSEDSDQPDGDVKDIWSVEKDPVIENGILWFSVYLVGQLGKGLVKDILDIGAGIPLSSSGYGEVNRDGTVDVESYDLERYSDFVLNPSYKVYGFKDYTENSPVKESVDSSKLGIGNKIKFEDTYWIITKIDNPDNIEVRKANQDSIFKTISAKEIQEVMNEKKIQEVTDSDIKNTYLDFKEDGENESQAIEKTAEKLNIDSDEVKAVLKKEESTNKDKKQEGKSMNKKFTVEEKSFRLNVKNLIKEADAKTDFKEKLESYNEILTWFGEEFEADDLKKEVESKVQDTEKTIEELAKKGEKTDDLEKQQESYKKALAEVHYYNKKISEKYAVASEMLNNLKTFSVKMKELYENQKARANGMVPAGQYKEALDAVELLKGKIKEAKIIIKKLKEENEEKQKELDKKEEEEKEAKKVEERKQLQRNIQKLFREEEEQKKEEEQETKKKEEAEKDEEKKVKESINMNKFKKEIEEYYQTLEKSNSDYKQFKDQILECRTLIEAQKYVMKIKDMVHGRIPRDDSYALKQRFEKKNKI